MDYPGFNLRIAKWAKKEGIPVAYYISPQIWAWKQSRIHEIKRCVDKMFVILPFEEAFYAKFNLTMNRFIIDYENPDAGIGHSLGYINSAIKIATQHNLHFAFSPLQIKKSSSSDLQWRYKQFIRKITFRKIYETHDIGNDLNYLFAFDLLYSNRSSIEDKIKNGVTPLNVDLLML